MEGSPASIAGYFPGSGRKHSLHLKLRGANDSGGAIISGKTRQQAPRWEAASGHADGAAAQVGHLKDLLSAQRAEAVEEQRKAASRLATLEKDLLVARQHRVGLMRAHEVEMRVCADAGEAQASLLTAELTAAEEVSQRLAGELKVAARQHEQELARKLAMIDRRDLKLQAANAVQQQVDELHATATSL